MNSRSSLLCVMIACVVLLALLLPSIRATEANLQCIQNGNCKSSAVFGDFDPATKHNTNRSVAGISVEALLSQSFGSTVNTNDDSLPVIEPSPIPTVDGSIQNFSLSDSGYPIARPVNVIWSSVPPVIEKWLRKFAGQESLFVEFSSASARYPNPQSHKVVQVETDTFPTPEPVSFTLLGSGLIIVGGVLRRRLRK